MAKQSQMVRKDSDFPDNYIQHLKATVEKVTDSHEIVAFLWVATVRIDELVKSPTANHAYVRARLDQLVEDLRDAGKEYAHDKWGRDVEAKLAYDRTIAFVTDLEKAIEAYINDTKATLTEVRNICEQLTSTLQIQAIKNKVKFTPQGRNKQATRVKIETGIRCLKLAKDDHPFESNKTLGEILLNKLEANEDRDSLENQILEALKRSSYRMRKYISECITCAPAVSE